MPWKSLSTRTLAIGLFLIIGLCVAFYLLIGRGARASVSEKIMDRQELLVRAQKSNIESFFQVFGESVAVLSQLKTITSSSSAIWDFDVFVEQWRDTGLVDGVVLTDERGILQLNSNIAGTHSAGVSLADRDYFLWAKNGANKGEYYVGKPVISRLGVSEGRYIIPVAAPVYQENKFKGVLVAAVNLANLTENNLEMLRISTEQLDVFIVGKDGELYYSNTSSEGVGQSVYEMLKTNPFPGSQGLEDNIKRVLNEGAEGTRAMSFRDPVSGDLELHAVAYSTIKMGDRKWGLIVATPIQNIWGFTIPVYVRLTTLALLVALTVYVFGVIAVKEVGSKKVSK
jgi:C4-dicarboxylate-specific signal transduction histidine kinase